MKSVLLSLFAWPLIAYPQCKTLRKTTDKFENKTSITTSILKPVRVQRIIQSDTTYHYLSLNASANASADRKGVIVLLANGQRLEWPDEKVEVNLYGSLYHWGTNFNATAFIALTPEQLLLLSQQSIKDYRLYVFDNSLKERDGESVREEINCLRTVDPNSVKEK